MFGEHSQHPDREFESTTLANDRLQITMEDLKVVEGVCRKDPKVIEQCDILGIPPEDMHKVYCDRTSQFLVVISLTALTHTHYSMDDRLRRTLRQQNSPPTSADVLPTPRRRQSIYIPTRLLPNL